MYEYNNKYIFHTQVLIHDVLPLQPTFYHQKGVFKGKKQVFFEGKVLSMLNIAWSDPSPNKTQKIINEALS